MRAEGGGEGGGGGGGRSCTRHALALACSMLKIRSSSHTFLKLWSSVSTSTWIKSSMPSSDSLPSITAQKKSVAYIRYTTRAPGEAKSSGASMNEDAESDRALSAAKISLTTCCCCCSGCVGQETRRERGAEGERRQVQVERACHAVGSRDSAAAALTMCR